LIAAHVLRPLNVRLWWQRSASDPPLPEQFHAYGKKKETLLAGTVHGSRADGSHTILVTDALQQTTWKSLEGTFAEALQNAECQLADGRAFTSLGQLAERSYPAAKDWGVNMALARFGVGVVELDLGATSSYAPDGGLLAAVDPGPTSGGSGQGVEPSVHDTLVRAATSAKGKTKEGAFAEATPATPRYIELSARLLATAVAYTVWRLVHPETHTNHVEPAFHGVDLSDPQADPLRERLGLSCPSARTLDNFDSDLNSQASKPKNHDPTAAWTDLVAYYRRAWEPTHRDRGSAWNRHTPLASPDGRERLTPYDVLAGIARPNTVKAAQDRLPLPPPYGGWTLGLGDADAGKSGHGKTPVYEKTTRQPDCLDDAYHILQLQYDLWQVGITLGVDAATPAEVADNFGRYGYAVWHQSGKRHWHEATVPASAWPRSTSSTSAKRRLESGNTSFAVRELRIAAAYPNAVYERLDAAPKAPRQASVCGDAGRHRYGDGLVVVSGTPPDTPALSTTPLQQPSPITGSLDPSLGVRLRRWRFCRRRYPVAVDVYSLRSKAVRAERLMAPRAALAHSTERMAVLDLSGYFTPAPGPDAAHRWHDLGDTAGLYGWTGPRRMRRHADRKIVDSDILPPVGSETVDSSSATGTVAAAAAAAAADESVMRVVLAAVRAESSGHWDVTQAYDSAVYSLPLRHAVAALWAKSSARRHSPHADGSTVGQLGGVVRNMQKDTAEIGELYQFAFGAFGVGASETVGTVGPTAFLTVPDGAPVTSGTSGHSHRDNAAYQAYAQWFRSWTWFHRFVWAIRHSPRMRRAIYA
ncbi:MAG TPA: hypothetical protein VJ986_01080, partial [Gaiellaceae bacterium]|nr:hypothetical protein [Gaiellaceae bacterium]